MIEGLAHIGVVVRSIEESLPALVAALGLEHTATEEVPSQKVRVAALEGGGQVIELVEQTSDDSPISRFLEKRGPGIHHIAFKVDDLEATLARLREAGVTLIDATPRPGAFGKRIAFLHPKSTGGILIELCDDGPAAGQGTSAASGRVPGPEFEYDLQED